MFFTNDEINLMCIWNQDDTREGMIESLTEMSRYLTEQDEELSELTASVIRKLNEITDEEFAEIELIPDFDF